MLKEELPFRCQPNTLGIAQKEAGMESVFQLLDGFADGLIVGEVGVDGREMRKR